ncbi:MAG: hypothetical protein Pg6C_04730 [Treponemataceae bacterium]|nr:MAG: hypothetical protein Pg6C_04730 [Treponemataceae bacterium]
MSGENNRFADRLAAYVDALRPIIYINHFDFHAVDELIAGIAGKDTKIYEYNEAGHSVDFGHKVSNSEAVTGLNSFLALFDENEPKTAFLVLKDAHAISARKAPTPRLSPV